MSIVLNQSLTAAKASRTARINRHLARELKRPQNSNPFADAHMRALANAINSILVNQYPGYTWRLGLSRNPPLISLRCEQVLTREVININPRDVQNFDDLKTVIVQQCGQFLERCAVSREGVIDSQVEQLTAGYSRFVIPDRSNLPIANMDKRFARRAATWQA